MDKKNIKRGSHIQGTGFYRFGTDLNKNMLKIIIDSEHDVDAQVYLHGLCSVFALALSECFGYKIKMICDSEDAPTLDNLIHVFCIVDDPAGRTQYIDARGITTDKKLFCGEFQDFFRTPVYQDVNADELKALILNEFFDNSGYIFFLSCAKQLIDRYPKYYKVETKDYILSRDNLCLGEIKNTRSRLCPMIGCTGVRMHVKWPDGRSTYPCTKGCSQIGAHLWKVD